MNTACVGFSCENGGMCDSQQQRASCRCPIKFPGPNCDSGKRKNPAETEQTLA